MSFAGRRGLPSSRGAAASYPGTAAGVPTGARHHHEHQPIFGDYASPPSQRSGGGSGRIAGHPEYGEAPSPARGPKGAAGVHVATYSGTGEPLSAPKGVDFGVFHEQGRRPAMEDAHVCLAPLPGTLQHTHFFCVADGHSGRAVADHVAELLPAAVAKRLSGGASPPAALSEAFVSVDRDVYRKMRGRDGGAAAVVALFCGTTLWVAWVGDCRAVLCERGSAVSLTSDHRPCDRHEQKRVEAAGGFIAFGRVGGCLAVTRAFGDYELKGGERVLSQAMLPVSNVPQISRFELTSHSEFLLLACDGVFDVMENADAASICREQRQRGPQRMAQAVVKSALERGTMDNVTALVVTLSSPAAAPAGAPSAAPGGASQQRAPHPPPDSAGRGGRGGAAPSQAPFARQGSNGRAGAPPRGHPESRLAQAPGRAKAATIPLGHRQQQHRPF
eukprot:TRINITY_DN6358_c0_g1_i1.p1 TRINITY_DN6358_c0_g1~~TRINITY_DN6358_c0_g1_i1.p1  ORF type:complete len:472 (+),score=82.45 TRINITY_DN6358_c0_g1_i1:82-1416(+)